MALRFVLADAELELVPPEVAGHPAVRSQAEAIGKRPAHLLLDQNQHGPAIRKLPGGDRRGRPDIVQYTLLTLLESPLAKADGLEVAVHTRDGILIRIRPDTRLPRGEARFQGLIAKVLLEGRSQPEDPLLWSEGKKAPAQALSSFAKGPVLRLDETGAAITPTDLAARAEGGELTVVLGAFPSGDFPEAWKKAAPEAASIWPAPLNAWAVAAELVAAFRAKWGPAGPA